MSTEDDAEARRARAEKLRAEIARLKSPHGQGVSPKEPPAEESPREFVERRARELAEGESKPE